MENKIILFVQIALIVFFFSVSSSAFPQNRDNCDLKFINHLVEKGDFKEALFLLDSTNCSSDQLNDSVNYLRGWSHYSLQQLPLSSESLLKVRSTSEFYLKSHFFAAYNYSHAGEYDNAIKTLSEISLSTEKQLSLKNLELAGTFLLQGNIEKFESSFAGTDKKYYEISQSYDNIRKISDDLKNHKRKSPVVAGIMSGIIPGSGKFYAGKKGEAVSAFITTSGLGVVTWENYRKRGIDSFGTIAFGTAFAFSYISNIYGAVVTVNILETEYRDNVKNTILFNLHIPLRNTFNK